MKKLLSLCLLALLAIGNAAQGGTVSNEVLSARLSQVNRYWAGQQQAVPAGLTAPQGDRALIRMHLQLVEQALRAKDASGLPFSLQKARQQHLDNLHAYWQSGAFPINTTHAYRLPIFIDPFDNFCAVGYLVKASGHEQLSRHIAATTNFAYLADMRCPELNAWAASSGLTLDELAWIQPAYPPSSTLSPMLGGTNGVVKALLPLNGAVYAAGNFQEVDGTANAGNIAFYGQGFAGPFWSKMADGLVGEVEALQVYNGELYAAGHDLLPTGAIHSVVKWNGSQWETTGAFGGMVKALAVYQGKLYAAGSTGMGVGFLTRFENGHWVDPANPTFPPTTSISGTIHSLHEHDNKLILGGEFTVTGINSPNIVAFDGSNFSPVGGGVPAKVRALATFKGKLFAGGDYLSAQGDTFGLARFDGTAWLNLTANGLQPSLFPPVPAAETFVSALVPHADFGLVMGGSFHTSPSGIGYYGINLSMYYEDSSDPQLYWSFGGMAMLDRPVHALAIDGQTNTLYAGGAFTQSGANPPAPAASVGYMLLQPLGTAPLLSRHELSVFPNPFAATATVQVPQLKAQEQATIRVFDIIGRKIAEEKQLVTSENTLSLHRGQLTRGTYLLQIEQGNAKTGMVRLVVD